MTGTLDFIPPKVPRNSSRLFSAMLCGAPF